jgi:hypothetical protein
MFPIYPLQFSIPLAPGSPSFSFTWAEILSAHDDEAAADVLRARMRQVAALGQQGFAVAVTAGGGVTLP